MSMNVDVDLINLLTKIVIDRRSTININIDVTLNIKTSKIDKINLIDKKSANNELINKKK